MSQFQQVNQKQTDNTVIHTPDISTNFILNSAIHDATNILLRPYLTPSFPLSCHPNICVYTKDSELIKNMQEHTGKPQYFVTRMAIIAWDFLNLSSIFHYNMNQQEVE